MLMRASFSLAYLVVLTMLLTSHRHVRALGDEDKLPEPVQQEIKRLQGKWQVVQIEEGGKIVGKAPDEAIKSLCLIISGRTYNVQRGDFSQTAGEYSLGLETTPKTMTVLTKDESLPKGQTILFIYALDGDTLTTCGTAVGGVRPKEFVTKPGSPDIMVKYKRVKADKP